MMYIGVHILNVQCTSRHPSRKEQHRLLILCLVAIAVTHSSIGLLYENQLSECVMVYM